MIDLFSKAQQEYAAHPEAHDDILAGLANEELFGAGSRLPYRSGNALAMRSARHSTLYEAFVAHGPSAGLYCTRPSERSEGIWTQSKRDG